MDVIDEYRYQGQVVQFGQRTLAKLPLYVVFDREANSGTINLGGSMPIPTDEQFALQISISLGIVVILFVMLVYLIYLRRNRMEAEKWLQNNKNILFNSALGLKSEEEILEALVKSQKMQEKLNDPNVQKDVKRRNSNERSRSGNWSDDGDDKGQPLLQGTAPPTKDAGAIHTDDDDDKSAGSDRESGKQVPPPSGKVYTDSQV